MLGTTLAVKMIAYIGVEPVAAALAERLPRRAERRPAAAMPEETTTEGRERPSSASKAKGNRHD